MGVEQDAMESVKLKHHELEMQPMEEQPEKSTNVQLTEAVIKDKTVKKVKPKVSKVKEEKPKQDSEIVQVAQEEKSKNKALLSDQNAKVSESKAKTKIPDTSKIYLDQKE